MGGSSYENNKEKKKGEKFFLLSLSYYPPPYVTVPEKRDLITQKKTRFESYIALKVPADL